MALIDVEIGPEEVGEFWKPEQKGDTISGHIYKFVEDSYNGKKQIRIKLYLGEENGEAKMTLLPSHAHLKRYYVNLERGDYIVVTVTDVHQPTDENGEPKGWPRFKYLVQTDPDKKVKWPDEDDGSDYEVERVVDDGEYYA